MPICSLLTYTLPNYNQMKIILILTFLLPALIVSAQWECKSKLGAQLKPVGESDLLWASEVTTTGGYLTNSAISSAMGFVGLDYTTSNHSFYVEGGVKYWNKYDLDRSVDYANYRLGFREAFYQLNQNTGHLTVGLHSASLKDDYLLNERVLGLSYEYNFDRVQVNATLGTVSTAFSRNGKFCSTCFLYDIIPNRPLPVIGHHLGETNMAGVRINFLPSQKSDDLPTTTSVDDEFASFSDEFASETTTDLVTVSEYGALLYTEFNRAFENPFATGGMYLNLSTLGGVDINTEVLMQADAHDLGVIASCNIEKSVFWDNAHQSSFLLSYYGFYGLTDDAVALNRFSNILAGQVLRLDAPELPIYLASFKHRIPSLKAHVKCQYALSTYTDSMQEVDVQIGKTFLKRLQVSVVGAYVTSDLIPEYNNTYLAQVEARYSF